VTKTHNIIKINGKSYDALTGKPVGHSGTASRSIDGVVRAAASQPVAQPSHAKPITHKHQKARPVAPAAKLHKPHPSHTLMRHAVSKPTPKPKAGVKAVMRTDILAKATDISVAPKLSIAAVDKRREARAKRVSKSKLVSRFGSFEMVSYTISRPLEVINKPVTSPVAAPSVPATTLQPVSKSMDLFQKALQRANSHELQPAPVKKRAHATKKRKAKSHRLANMSAAALAVVLVGGFLAYQNVANVQLRMASSKAGFAASLPSYRPAGFSIGKFAYSPGAVTIKFHSNSDSSRSFAIIEKPSSWDSETLLNDFVATKAASYQTVQTGGRTVYIYGQNKATWVNHGVWYNVDSDGSLSTNQLVSLAASM
jgi:hypothetical protein